MKNKTNWPQLVSSLPSTQSRILSHQAVDEIHVPLPQRNWFALQAIRHTHTQTSQSHHYH